MSPNVCSICALEKTDVTQIADAVVCFSCAQRVATEVLLNPRECLDKWWNVRPGNELEEHLSLLREKAEDTHDPAFVLQEVAQAFADLLVLDQAIMNACAAIVTLGADGTIISSALRILFGGDSAAIARRIADSIRGK